MSDLVGRLICWWQHAGVESTSWGWGDSWVEVERRCLMCGRDLLP